MVLATDLSREMLHVAAKRAQAEGFTTIMTRVMDAEQLNLEERSFDAVNARVILRRNNFDPLINIFFPFNS